MDKAPRGGRPAAASPLRRHATWRAAAPNGRGAVDPRRRRGGAAAPVFVAGRDRFGVPAHGGEDAARDWAGADLLCAEELPHAVPGEVLPGRGAGIPGGLGGGGRDLEPGPPTAKPSRRGGLGEALPGLGDASAAGNPCGLSRAQDDAPRVSTRRARLTDDGGSPYGRELEWRDAIV
ncbi:unnamed protein product [Durusdinium trenchii]|uniref:Uncharacterized protein n=1 Tax=Durusdinium trenchii TaxID=1381693 RepID=A0ABP0NEH9_9DINO